MKPATLRLERVARGWRDLAERRRNHFLKLYQSGRWRRYYTDAQFRQELRQAIAIADRWAAIAPSPKDLARDELGAHEAPLPAQFDRPDDLAA